MFRDAVRVVLLFAFSTMLVSCAVKPVPLKGHIFSPRSLPAEKYQQKVDTFLVILDSSSSMAEAYKGQIKLNIAKDFLEAMNQTIPAIKLDAALRTFGPSYAVYDDYRNLVYGMGAYSQAGFAGALEKMKYAGGYSPLGDAIAGGIQDLKSAGGNLAVIIVSDARDMDGSPVKAAAKMKSLYGDRVCIYTVLVGDDPAGEKLSQQIAAAGKCGFSVRADSFDGAGDMGEFVKKVFFSAPDADRDGVLDADDRCPGTPAGVRVDQHGCPLDADGDGVLDYKDKCPKTPRGAKVDAAGCWEIAPVLFDTAKFDIKPQYQPLLDEVASVLKTCPQTRVEIHGHTDIRGSKPYNQKLSENRAKSVMDYLKKAGINIKRMIIKGFGFDKPAASNATPEGMGRNRRAEVVPAR